MAASMPYNDPVSGQKQALAATTSAPRPHSGYQPSGGLSMPINDPQPKTSSQEPPSSTAPAVTPTAPTGGKWAYDKYDDCCDDPACFCAWCCAHCQTGSNAEAIGENYFLFCMFSVCAPFFAQCVLRGMVRQRYNITQADCCDGEANMFDDFCSVYWCMPCTLVQEARQIRGGKK